MSKIESAGIVIVRYIDSKPHYLLMRSYSYWDFPKGKLEGEETHIQAALREVKEETGLTQDNLTFPLGYIKTETEPYNSGKGNKKIAHYFIAVTEVENIVLPISEKLGKPEHDEWRWLVYDEAITLVGNRILNVLNWAKTEIEEHYDKNSIT